MGHTGVEQIQRLIEDIRLINFSVTTVDDERVADQQTRMADSRPRALCGRSERVTSHVAASLDHPQITLDGRTID